MSESDPPLDLADLPSLLADLQARLGTLPAGVTLMISVGAPPLPPAVPAVSPAKPSEDEMRLWYSPKELAALHAVRPATVQKWVRAGRFPGARRLPNGAIRIPKAEADTVLSTVVAKELAPVLPPPAGAPSHAGPQRSSPSRPSSPTVTFSGWRNTRRKVG